MEQSYYDALQAVIGAAEEHVENIENDISEGTYDGKVNPEELRATIERVKTDGPDIVVVVEGGVVSSVMSSVPRLGVTLRDFDNIKAGDPDPMAEFCRDPKDSSACDYSFETGAGMPHEVF